MSDQLYCYEATETATQMRSVSALVEALAKSHNQIAIERRKALDEVQRLESLVEMLQGWLADRDKTCETLRKARDNYARQLGLAHSDDVMQSVREKYDPREELEEVEA